MTPAKLSRTKFHKMEYCTKLVYRPGRSATVRLEEHAMSFKRPLRDQEPGESDAARTLSKGFEILRAFRPGETYLGNKELAERTNLSKSTVSRLTGVLIKLGYLRYSPELGRYALGVALLSLAHPMLTGLGVRHIARPVMKELADSVGGQVSLGMRDGPNIIYIESSRSLSHVLTVPEIGAAIPIVASAIGRAYLAALPKPKYLRICSELRTGNPTAWNTHKASIERAAEELSDYGFTRSFGDIRPEIRSCGVPIRVRIDDEFLVMNCGVPARTLKRGQLEREIGPRLVSAARMIEAACGTPWLRLTA